MSRLRLMTRIALFSALVYATSWSLALLPNIKVSFFIIFTAGFVWGVTPGMLVGAVGTGLWSMFNPYGPVALPILMAQVIGSASCGVVGGIYQSTHLYQKSEIINRIALIMCGIICTAVYYIPVTLADAWLFQPFWPRIIAGIPWTTIALATNALIFPLLFGAAWHLYDREKARL